MAAKRNRARRSSQAAIPVSLTTGANPSVARPGADSAVIPVALEKGVDPLKRGPGTGATNVAVIPVAVENSSKSSQNRGRRGKKARATKLAAIPVAIQGKQRPAASRPRKSVKSRRNPARQSATHPATQRPAEAPGLFSRAVKQMVDLQTNAVGAAGALSLAAIATAETAATLMITAPAAILTGRAPVTSRANEPVRLLTIAPPAGRRTLATAA